MLPITRRMMVKYLGLLSGFAAAGGRAGAQATEGTEQKGSKEKADFEPTWESIESHELPQWYDDAKLGIFIHWGVYSVPAWAPVGEYAEWYPNHMHKEGSPTNDYHNHFYGAPVPENAEDGEQVEEGEQVFEYKDFIRQTDTVDAPENFNAENWDPERWADLFEEIGAGYVIPVGEHHDGFAMWDTDITKWNAAEMGPERDVVGELADAVRERDMKFAASYHRMMNYYDPRYTGLFGNPNYRPLDEGGPQKPFVDEWRQRWEELRDSIKPDLLWFDGDWTAPYDFWGTQEVVAEYYNIAKSEWDKEVAVNDRLGKVRTEHGDFYTPEYETYDRIIDHKWETTRGIGYSFGYNRNEESYFYLSVEELVQSFVDVVSKNGNLLLNVGPMANGIIPEVQKKRLRGMGEWLQKNGEAIFGTSYWVEPEEPLVDTELRYTTKDEYVYAILYEWPGKDITLGISKYLDIPTDGSVELLTPGDCDRSLEWSVSGKKLTIRLPSQRPGGDQPAYALKIQAVTEGENAFEHAAANYEGQITYSIDEVTEES